jgi:hypothetical protein
MNKQVLQCSNIISNPYIERTIINSAFEIVYNKKSKIKKTQNSADKILQNFLEDNFDHPKKNWSTFFNCVQQKTHKNTALKSR